MKNVGLQAFLETKPLYYNEIDYARMPRAYASIEEKLNLPKIIHVVGTNGKGTTGRFLANALWRSGYGVGHYTSPHILQFNERIWLDGESVSDELLEKVHQRLLLLLDQVYLDTLSYFEYTTLLAILVYEGCDWVVLEAGLGGEHDATNVFPKVLSIFTPIDFDHQAFLGDSIEAIAATKLRSMESKALIGKQPHQEVYTIYKAICKECNTEGYIVQEILESNDLTIIETVVQQLKLVEYLQENLGLCIAAMRLLKLEVRTKYFCDAQLFGRLTPLNEKIWIDVGHNQLAASAITSALCDKKVILVYNTYKDKAYDDILALLKPIVEAVEIIKVDDERIESRHKLERSLRTNGIDFRDFSTIDVSKQYLVFGSFSVVEAFLKEYDGK